MVKKMTDNMGVLVSFVNPNDIDSDMHCYVEDVLDLYKDAVRMVNIYKLNEARNTNCFDQFIENIRYEHAMAYDEAIEYFEKKYKIVIKVIPLPDEVTKV